MERVFVKNTPDLGKRPIDNEFSGLRIKLSALVKDKLGSFESDEFYFLKQSLTTQREALNRTSFELLHGDDFDDAELRTRYAHLVNQCELIRRQLVLEKKRLFKIKNKIVSCIISNTSILTLRSRLMLDINCRSRSKLVNSLVDMLELEYKKYILNLENIRKLKLRRVELRKQARYNRYRCLGVEEEAETYSSCPEWEDEDSGYISNFEYPFHDFSAMRRRLKRKYVFDRSNLISNQERLTRETVPPVERDAVLVARLRSIIKSFQSKRLKSVAIRSFQRAQRALSQLLSVLDGQAPEVDEEGIELTEFTKDLDLEEIPLDLSIAPEMGPFNEDCYIENQMESEAGAHGACNDLKNEKKENVILTTHTKEESVADPIDIPVDNWANLCASNPYAEFSSMMSRWQLFQTLWWSKDTARGHMVDNGKQTLPLNFIKQLKNSPSCTLFKNFAYFKSDMEIKFQINSNKFHCGSLMASFYYSGSMDKYYKDRENIYCASQMTHVVIDAASANDAVLKIPYRHYKPIMGTTDRYDDAVVLDMGYLRVFVLNQLRVPKDDTNKVEVKMYFRFVNPVFYGMKPRTVGDLTADNEMMSAAGLMNIVKDTASLINQHFPDPQRDNPKDVIPPKPMVPWSAPSWCVGDVLPEPINPLRLQASGNCPHPPGTLPSEDEMQIKYITSVFGLVKRIEWKKEQVGGTKLYSMPFSPFWRWDDWPKVTCSNPTPTVCRVLPPISVLSSLFGYWRGSIEYKFDFIATQFHTGRIIIAYLPRVILEEDRNVTVEELTACDHIVVDLREERQVIFTCPFLSDKPWWPRRGSSKSATETYPPGFIYIYVQSQLSTSENISEIVDINVYMRAGPDFELQIPVAPSIGLSFNTDVFYSHDVEVSYLPTYGPPEEEIYIGTWHSVGSDKGVFRYGPGSDHVTQFPRQLLLDSKGKSRVYVVTDAEQIFLKRLVNKTTQQIACPYLVMFANDDTYCYGAPFVTRDQAVLFANRLSKGRLTPNAITFMETISESGPYLTPKNIVYWKDANLTVHDFEIIGQAGEERTNACGDAVRVAPDVKSTWGGFITFGESIKSIKPLLRRYQPYCQFINTQTGKMTDPSRVDFMVPIMPQGLDFDVRIVNKGVADVEKPYENRLRDGPIPILASGYRFFRGSVSLRCIVSGQKDGAFWVQHRPEYALQTTKVMRPDSKNYAEGYFQPGYATMIQMSEMNNVVCFEVPFYLPGQFGLLQRPRLDLVEDAVHYNLGMICCGFDVMKGTPQEVAYLIQMFYKMGDDMSFSVFQGFPPMMDLNIFKEPNTQLIESQGPLDFVKNAITKSATDAFAKSSQKALDEAVADVRKKHEEQNDLAKFHNGLVDLIKLHFKDFSKEKQQTLINAVSQMVHVVINPSIKTIAVAIITIFISMGLLCYSYLEKLIGSLKNLLTKWMGVSQDPQESVSGSNPELIESQGPGVDEESAFVSTVVVSMLAMIGATDRPLPNSIPNFAKYLYEGLPKFSLSANHFYRFLQNNLVMFKRIWYWLLSKINSQYIFQKELSQSPEEVINIIREIQFCLDTRNSDAVRKDPRITGQVYQLATIAESYMAKKIISDVAKPMPFFDDYCRRIIKLRNELSDEMINPPVRFEPYVVCLVGDVNLGKSHASQIIAMELLKSIDYKSYNELVYVRTPGNAYWNGLRQQPVCLYDDFLNIEAAPSSISDISELFQLKSKAVFNPPMAAIEEKKIRYNPLLTFLCMNKAFPKISGLGTPEAWQRRRDVLIHCKKLEKYRGISPRDMSAEDKRTFAHLRFGIYSSSIGGTAENEKQPECKLTYGELLSILCTRFNNYFNEECAQYYDSLERLRSFYPDPTLDKEEYERKYNEYAEQIQRDKEGDYDLIQTVVRQFAMQKHKAPIVDFIQDRINKTKAEALKKEKELKAVASTSVVAQADDKSIIVDKRIVESQQRMAIKIAPLEVEKMCNCIHILRQGWRSLRFTPVAGSQGLLTISYGFGTPAIDYPLDKCESDKFCMFDDGDILAEIDPDLSKQLGQMLETHWPLKLQIWHKTKQESNEPATTIPFVHPDTQLAGVVEEIGNEEIWYKRIWSKLPGFGTIFKWLLAGIALVGSLVGLLSLARTLFGFKEESSIQQLEREARRCVAMKTLGASAGVGVASYAMSQSKYEASPRVVSSRPILQPKIFQQASESLEHNILRKIKRNSFFLYVTFYEEGIFKTKSYRCLGLVDKYFLLLDHYYYDIKTKQGLKMYYVHDTATVELTSEIFENMQRLPDSTLILCVITPQVPRFCNIIKFIVPSAVTGCLPPGAYLVETTMTDLMTDFETNIHRFDRVLLDDSITVNNDDGSQSVVNNVFRYSKGGRGMCGSVLVSAGNLAKPILGIHIAGINSSGVGFAEALVAETFLHLVSNAIIESESDVIVNQLKPEFNHFLNYNVDKIGSVSSSMKQTPPVKSRLIHTINYNQITPSTYDVPVLSNKDTRLEKPFSPLIEGCKFHAYIVSPFPKEFLDRAIEHVNNKIMALVKPQRLKPSKLTFEQAICGLPDNSLYEKLDLRTSEGFPHILRRPKGASNKSWMFSIEETSSGIKLLDIEETLFNMLIHKDVERKQGIYQHTIFVDCLKDAKLPKEKVLLPGKTRVFSVAPVDFTIHQRQYTCDFVVAFQAARNNLDHSVGIDIYSRETDLLINSLLKISNNFICGDYSKFGDQLLADIVMGFYNMVNVWNKKYLVDWESSWTKVMKCFAEETSHALHLMIDLVYKCYGGMPSGNALTVVINSYVNMIYIRVVWQLLCVSYNRVDLISLNNFEKHVRLTVYGDDIMMTVSDEVLAWFNGITISNTFAKYGIKFTSVNKVNQPVVCTRINDAETTFLKCNFERNIENVWAAKMDIRVVNETSNWTWNTHPDVEMSSKEACLAMMELSYGHGEHFYQNLRKKVIEFWNDRGHFIDIPDWRAVHARIYHS